MKKLLTLGLLLFFNTQTATAQDNVSQIVSSQGFTAQSFLRGVLGMFVLILISYILSANRKAINWRTVGLGLGAQIILAIGVLKVSFVQTFFEWVGSLFICELWRKFKVKRLIFIGFKSSICQSIRCLFLIE